MLSFKSRKYLYAPALLLVLCLLVVPPWSVPRARATSKPLIGAIRWDAWFPDVTTFSGYVNPSVLTSTIFACHFMVGMKSVRITTRPSWIRRFATLSAATLITGPLIGIQKDWGTRRAT